MTRSGIRDLDVDTGTGLTLHVVERGAGPPLLLIHGFTGSTETWSPLVPHLAAAHRVIAVDLPGHGRSSAPSDSGRYALDRFAGDLVRVLDDLSIDRVALLGYSMGGRAGLRFALAHVDRLAALILESTSPGIPDPQLQHERLAADLELADVIERDGIETFVDRWERLPLWESQEKLPAGVRQKLREQRLANRAIGLANSLRGAGAGVDMSVLDRLGEIQAPVLVVAGALDSRYVELGQTMVSSIPNARMVVVPGSGHAVHLEQPEALTDSVVSFLHGLPSDGGRWL